MFDVGASELLVIAITALLVVGPDRLPRVARTAGLYLGRARRAVYQLRLEVERELDAEDLARARQLVQRGNLPLDTLQDGGEGRGSRQEGPEDDRNRGTPA
jgi:sec-independent protein translocase protein TatB